MVNAFSLILRYSLKKGPIPNEHFRPLIVSSEAGVEILAMLGFLFVCAFI
jgi:hypothetical protein